MHAFKRKIATLTLAASLIATPAYAANYQVQEGDSLYKIAARYHITLSELMEANNLTSPTIYTGKYLYVPEGGSFTADYYTVQKGDSLYKIAARLGVSVERLKTANALAADTIQIGQQLLIPTVNQTVASRASYITLTAAEIELMARVVYGESRGEPFVGQVAVAAVILNRVADSEFPNTVSAVIYQKYAFTAVSDGQYNLTPDNSAYQAVRAALTSDPTCGATYYWNPATATSQWVWSREVTLKIGKHVFAR